MPGVTIRVLTWNVFHAHDGHPEARPDWQSTLLGTAVDSGTHLHLNRSFVTAVGRLIARAEPTVVMLQEMPPWAVARVSELAGMSAASALTAPRIGPASLRGCLGRLNPDLMRTHEGNANVLMVRPPWEVVPGSGDVVRLNPVDLVARTARRERMDARETFNWIWERRNLVTARMRHPDGRLVQIACCHCHSDRRTTPVEIPRAANAALDAAGDLPLILGGDLNADPSRMPDAFAALAVRGLTPVPMKGIDHVLVRGLEPTGAAWRWTQDEREIVVPWKEATRRILISDHAPVEVTLSM
jgi:Endonuclease/Exonuclease/phosphatase family